MENRKKMYAVHPGVAHAQAIIDNLASRTGRSLDEWCDLVGRDGPGEKRARRDWLKTEHGVGGTTASLITDVADGEKPENYDADAYLDAAVGYVNALYSGKKAHLAAIHDALIALSRDLGTDVRISPCRTLVPVYRNHVIAQIKPSTLTRVDFGLALKGAETPFPAPLIETGGLEKGDRITHRIPLTRVDEIDDEVERWLVKAYELDA